MKTFLMATRAGRPEHSAEAEPVVVDSDGRVVVLQLDDGERIELDHSELAAALGLPQQEAA